MLGFAGVASVLGVWIMFAWLDLLFIFVVVCWLSLLLCLIVTFMWVGLVFCLICLFVGIGCLFALGFVAWVGYLCSLEVCYGVLGSSFLLGCLG